MSGQDRTRWLKRQEEAAQNALRYYLGPTGIPDKLNALARLAQFSDAGDFMEAGSASQDLWNEPSIANAARYATAAGALAIPIASAKMMNDGVDVAGDAFRSMKDDLGTFLREEDGTFGGWFAKTADKEALKVAEEMAESGASRTDIWEATGWFKGADDKWRFEIDDSVADVTPRVKDAYANPGQHGYVKPVETNIQGALEHPELYDAYEGTQPFWGDASIRSARTSEGAYNINTDGIRSDGIDPQTHRSTLLHELQHGIQQREGFAKGGNVAEFSGPRVEPDDVNWKEITPILDKYNIEGAGIGESAMQALNRMRDTAFKEGVPFSDLGAFDAERVRISELMWDQPSAYEQYKILAGEVEARNVQARANMTPEERAATAPWKTQDFRDEDQIVRFDVGNSAMASQPTPAQTKADEIINLLTTGRSSEVTDEMMAGADDMHLFNNYDLPMDEASRMARAKEMGFDTDVYHGGTHDVKAGREGDTIFLGELEDAESYAYDRGFTQDFEWLDSQLTPARVRNPIATNDDLIKQAKEAETFEAGAPSYMYVDKYQWPEGDVENVVNGLRAKGYTAAHITDDAPMGDPFETISTVGVFDPTAVRSRFARFDPRLKHLRNLSAGMAGMALMSPEEEEQLLREYLGE